MSIFNIYKPVGLTSFDCIRIMKNQFREQGFKKIKTGHAGTLDPFADGVLIICTEKDTKIISQIQNQPKEYLAMIKLGYTSDTYDIEGHLVETPNLGVSNHTTQAQINKIIQNNFTGEILQMPPIFSAKKINGQRAYQLARNNKSVNLSPKKVLIYKIDIIKYEYPFLTLKIECGSGTYIRSIAHDLGQILKTGAYCHALTRTRVGKYEIKNSQKLPAELVTKFQNIYLERKNKISNE